MPRTQAQSDIHESADAHESKHSPLQTKQFKPFRGTIPVQLESGDVSQEFAYKHSKQRTPKKGEVSACATGPIPARTNYHTKISHAMEIRSFATRFVTTTQPLTRGTIRHYDTTSHSRDDLSLRHNLSLEEPFDTRVRIATRFDTPEE